MASEGLKGYIFQHCVTVQILLSLDQASHSELGPVSSLGQASHSDSEMVIFTAIRNDRNRPKVGYMLLSFSSFILDRNVQISQLYIVFINKLLLKFSK